MLKRITLILSIVSLSSIFFLVMQEWNINNNLFAYVWIRLDSAKFAAIGVAIYLIPVMVALDVARILFGRWNRYIKIGCVINIINAAIFYFLFTVGHILQPDAGPFVYVTMAVLVLMGLVFTLFGFKGDRSFAVSRPER